MSKLREASRAVGRGSTGEALVLLWNELEPARLAADEGRLAGIESLAATIAVRGDEADRREAERLLEALERFHAEQSDVAAATARVEGELSPVGEQSYETVEEEVVGERRGGRGGLSGLLWLVLLAAIVLFNLLGDLLDR